MWEWTIHGYTKWYSKDFKLLGVRTCRRNGKSSHFINNCPHPHQHYNFPLHTCDRSGGKSHYDHSFYLTLAEDLSFLIKVACSSSTAWTSNVSSSSDENLQQILNIQQIYTDSSLKPHISQVLSTDQLEKNYCSPGVPWLVCKLLEHWVPVSNVWGW